MKKFKVTGMSCAACSARVERAVGRVAGVDSCSVNLLTGALLVSGEVSEADITAAVIDAGYGIAEERRTGDSEAVDKNAGILRRLVASALLFLPLFYLSMGYSMMNFPLPTFIAQSPFAVALLEVFFSSLILIINRKFFISGTLGLLRGAPNMDTLVSLGSGVSYLYSVYTVVMIGVSELGGDTVAAFNLLRGLYLESAAMILVIITVGKLLEARAKGKTTSAIRALVDLTPKTVTVIRDGEEILIGAEEIRRGDIFLVRQGESIAVDGVVVDGGGVVDESALSGESIPVEKTVGSRVYAATVNRAGFLRCEATATPDETVIASVIRLVSDAAATKAPISKIADRVSGIFVPVVIGIAAITTLIWSIFGDAGFGYALARGISVLVISCPCALGLATPVAIMVGSGVGARRGILFKTAEALEVTGRARTVAFDKTGTLTRGEPAVCDVIAMGCEEGELVRLAASLEYASEHPLARAIVRHAEGVELSAVHEFEARGGLGVTAIIEGRRIYGGNLKFISEISRVEETLAARCDELSEEGKTPMLFADGDSVLGIIAVRDELKDDARETVTALARMGVGTVMLTGDNERTARAIAREVGIERVYAGILPAQKEKILRTLSAEGRVIMVGDGINDAPALTSADVGMAIGGGTEIAIDSADVVLLGRSLMEVPCAVALSCATLINIKENLFWAFIYNLIGIPLAAGVFIPLLALELPPMFGAMAMSLSSVCVILNALRLNLFKYNGKTKKTEAFKMEKVMKIEGMMCPHCEARVKNTLLGIVGVASAEVSHKTGEARLTLSGEVSDATLTECITAQGYKVLSVK